MLGPSPSFRPYPYEHLRRLSRQSARLETAIAQWADPRAQSATSLADLLGGPIEVAVVGEARLPTIGIEYLAWSEIRAHGATAWVGITGDRARWLSHRLIGAPSTSEPPRPTTSVEHALSALAVSAGLRDAGIGGQVWPLAGPPELPPDTIVIELAVTGPALDNPSLVLVCVPRAILVRVPPRTPRGWIFEWPAIVGRAAIATSEIEQLTARSVVVVERVSRLCIGDGYVALDLPAHSLPAHSHPIDPLVARVASGYVRSEMAIADQANLELTVQIGTVRRTLREIGELAVGQVVSLDRPLAGPYELRVGGRLIGRGELVDVEGELGVRIVSLVQE